jgi:hypothetical protein
MTRCIRLFFLLLVASICVATATAQEAYVYISTGDGTYAYDASSTGKLTPLKGRPSRLQGPWLGPTASTL